VLPPDTDGGAVELGEVSLTFLGRLAAEEPASATTAGAALDRLLAR
jgi:hypothetical protein